MRSRYFCPALFAGVLLTAGACERESRRFKEMPPGSTATNTVSLSSLMPGPTTTKVETRSPYQYNAYAINEGKMLFEQFNCVGCHGNGGGAMGPPLMDDEWIYGSDPQNIFASIVEGRPNGMPSWRGRIPNYEVWRIVSYIQSVSGHVSKDAAPTRSDNMMQRQSEQRKSEEEQKSSGPPPDPQD